MLGQLREDFGGVIVSDDMEMRAITDIYGFETSVHLGLSAGLDLFIHQRRAVSHRIVLPPIIRPCAMRWPRASLPKATCKPKQSGSRPGDAAICYDLYKCLVALIALFF